MIAIVRRLQSSVMLHARLREDCEAVVLFPGYADTAVHLVSAYEHDCNPVVERDLCRSLS